MNASNSSSFPAGLLMDELTITGGMWWMRSNLLHLFRLAKQLESHGVLYGIQISSPPITSNATRLELYNKSDPWVIWLHIAFITASRPFSLSRYTNEFFKAFPPNLAVSEVIFRINDRQSSVCCECFSTHHCPHYLLSCCPLLVNLVT